MIELIRAHEDNHTEEYYYKIRNKDRAEEFSKLFDFEKDARFIYLNKVGFNGLYRVNSKGFFNVPSGKIAKVKAYDKDNFEALLDYFNNSSITILNRDFQKAVETAQSGDFIYFDPPYFLSNGGISISSGKVVSVNKGDWDDKNKYFDVNVFTNDWLKECFRLLKNTGSIFVSGTHHLAQGRCPPLIYKSKFKFSHKMIIWSWKGNAHYFNYDEMFKKDSVEMEDVWTLPAVSMIEKKYGYHPTQKPESLLERIIISSTKEDT